MLVSFDHILGERGRGLSQLPTLEPFKEGATESLHVSQVTYQARAYPGFCSMRLLGVFLLLPGCI